MRFIRRLLIVTTSVLAWWMIATLAYEIASYTTPRMPPG
jgi:hypothetical protein